LKVDLDAVKESGTAVERNLAETMPAPYLEEANHLFLLVSRHHAYDD
jgi:hypothetical protein